MTIKIHIIDSEEQENKAEHNYTDLKLGYLQSKSEVIIVSAEIHSDTNVSVSVGKVVFDDGTVWKKEEAVYESTGDIEDLEEFAKAKNKHYEDNYIICEETITSKNLVYDSTMEEVKKQEETKQEKEGKVYRIKEETNDKIVYTRKLKQNCPNHFKVILEKENIVVYNVVDE